VFYNPENHQKIIKLLENKKPSGIVTIAHDDKAVFPIIEDGDFCIPSAYVSKSEGEKIISHINYEAALKIVSERKESQGANVIGLKQGKNKQKIVVCAHFDTKPTTPGAIDNASGTAVLLRIAELMRDKKIDNNLELVAFNGEDYYSVPGQMQYLNDNVMENIALVINVDGVGIKNRKIGVAYINIEESRREKFLELHHEYKNIRQIEPWVQGDHSMFTMQGIPALAITSEDIFDLLESIIHSPEDTFDKVDHNLIEETARFVIDILLQIEKSL
jgi:aminopeptidase YwaD